MVRKAKESVADGAVETVTRTRLAVLRLARRLRQQAFPGITPSQQSALAAIEHAGPLTLGALAAIENVRPPSITRIVAALEEQGGWSARSTRPIAASRPCRSACTAVASCNGSAVERNAWLARAARPARRRRAEPGSKPPCRSSSD